LWAREYNWAISNCYHFGWLGQPGPHLLNWCELAAGIS
jgi:hypothetical protein